MRPAARPRLQVPGRQVDDKPCGALDGHSSGPGRRYRRRSRDMRVPSLGRARRLLCAVVAATATLCALSPGASAADAGSVRFAKAAESSFDAFTKSPTVAQQEWMRGHYWRMRTYAPYFNSRLSWYPNAWTYKDAYGIQPGSTLASNNDRFVLRDAGGRR